MVEGDLYDLGERYLVLVLVLRVTQTICLRRR